MQTPKSQDKRQAQQETGWEGNGDLVTTLRQANNGHAHLPSLESTCCLAFLVLYQ
jgi:hypothetical protein